MSGVLPAICSFAYCSVLLNCKMSNFSHLKALVICNYSLWSTLQFSHEGLKNFAKSTRKKCNKASPKSLYSVAEHKHKSYLLAKNAFFSMEPLVPPPLRVKCILIPEIVCIALLTLIIMIVSATIKNAL